MAKSRQKKQEGGICNSVTRVHGEIATRIIDHGKQNVVI